MTDLNFSTLIDVMQINASHLELYQTRHRTHKTKIKQCFDNCRHQYKTNPRYRQKVDRATFSYVKDIPPTSYLYKQIIRECIITNEDFTETDGLDFEHCVVSVAYCDYVVLNKNGQDDLRKSAFPLGRLKSSIAQRFSSLFVKFHLGAGLRISRI